MMIRTQGRKWLVPLNRGVYVRSDDSAKDYQILLDNGDPVGNGDLPLGKYASETRCLEILDGIQEKFQICNHYSGSGCETPSSTHDWNYGVYQMPEE